MLKFLYDTKNKYLKQIKKLKRVLAGVAQWIEHGPANPKVVSSVPSQGSCQGCGPRPHLGAHEGQPHIDVSLPLFLPL